MNRDDLILQELRAVREAQEAILAELRAMRPRQPDHDCALVAEIHQRVGGDLFTVADLLAYARNESKPLRAAITALLGELNGRRLGQFLARAEGKNYGGLQVERVSVDKKLGVLWAIRVCVE